MNTARNAISLHVHGVRAATRLPVIRRGLPLSTSSKLGLKESFSQTDVDYDKHKKDSLEKQKKGTGQWMPELASDSEEAVRADRSNEDIATLRERTKAAAAGESNKSGGN
ncbi:hypothetical protein C2857_002038 [Epichloe festucae Fl1]|uniref:Mitochondrial carrier protein PET8 n=1 Tax=Epichloe festucae (strain Fl1) TaxID=877507 RepID=A0A7S9KJW7_EPIFF|nr:hypothetical protein C2857_002038 [Epichloe festucae Fl1]